MPKEKTPEEVYDQLITEGLYEEASLDKDEIEKVIKLASEDYEFGKSLRKLSDANWRVIFNIKFPELELDWGFFETMRNARNQNKYKGADITREMWKKVEVQADLYIST